MTEYPRDHPELQGPTGSPHQRLLYRCRAGKKGRIHSGLAPDRAARNVVTDDAGCEISFWTRSWLNSDEGIGSPSDAAKPWPPPDRAVVFSTFPDVCSTRLPPRPKRFPADS